MWAARRLPGKTQFSLDDPHPPLIAFLGRILHHRYKGKKYSGDPICDNTTQAFKDLLEIQSHGLRLENPVDLFMNQGNPNSD